jgi:Na+/H+ antiporter NhaC
MLDCHHSEKFKSHRITTECFFYGSFEHCSFVAVKTGTSHSAHLVIGAVLRVTTKETSAVVVLLLKIFGFLPGVKFGV